jgi:hypothetical protein
VARLVDKGPHFGPKPRSGIGCGKAPAVSSQKTSGPLSKGPARHAVALQPPCDDSLTDSRSVARDDHRQRQVQRLSTIAQVLAFYGPETVLVLPPGPDVCPPWCPYCYRQRGAVAS